MSTLTMKDVSEGLLEQELQQLFLEHYDMLYGTAYSMLGNPSDAEDVPQTIFLRLLRSGLPPDSQQNPKGYLYRAAVNVSLNIIRSRKRQAPVHRADPVQVSANCAESDIEETFRRLADAIAELHPDAAEILILRCSLIALAYGDRDLAPETLPGNSHPLSAGLSSPKSSDRFSVFQAFGLGPGLPGRRRR